MSDPRRLSDADLLVWSVVLGYREQQKRDGIRVLLLPLPRCPACNAAVLEGAASWVREFGREEVTISMRPCGHEHWATLRAVEELQDHVVAMLGALERRMMTTDEIVGEAHARLDPPEGTGLDRSDRGQNPAVTDWTPPPPGDTREQLPDNVLDLIDVPSYTSTACETAQALEVAADANPGRASDLGEWRRRLHARCRLQNKFTGVGCRCACHLRESERG